MKTNKIENRIETILKKVRPYIKMHGGDVDLVGFTGGIAILHISGVCAHCSLADLTYNNLIAGLLKEEIPEVKGVQLQK
ncbi:NifU family protein [Patescibacteria group bacterium]|nr:NifU family protein [Patescibacteria group bacterium]MDE1946370.1 NifU family protein [Patescibacteria group bacterium]MDE2010822.1 NifU family protein [Patescibacteria group bacterium]MDE2233118.1 NifU family protein [Patescibacteria group bacterium]